MNDDLKKEVRKAALQNAVEHDGKTKDKIILSKVLGTVPEFKSRVKEIIPEITLIVSEINNMSLEQQRTEIQNHFPEIFSVKEKIKEDRVGFPPLEDAEQGKVKLDLRLHQMDIHTLAMQRQPLSVKNMPKCMVESVF